VGPKRADPPAAAAAARPFGGVSSAAGPGRAGQGVAAGPPLKLSAPPVGDEGKGTALHHRPTRPNLRAALQNSTIWCPAKDGVGAKETTAIVPYRLQLQKRQYALLRRKDGDIM